ncbi:MAG: hypothetical protein Q8K75_11740 [Chlamydiales bacterium]|nr:hypothetical protein [Chlamydiales bacterium]
MIKELKEVLFPKPTTWHDFVPGAKTAQNFGRWITAQPPKRGRIGRGADWAVETFLKPVGRVYYNVYFKVTGYNKPFSWEHRVAISRAKRGATITGRVAKTAGYSAAALLTGWALGAVLEKAGGGSNKLLNGTAMIGTGIRTVSKGTFMLGAVPTYLAVKTGAQAAGLVYGGAQGLDFNFGDDSADLGFVGQQMKEITELFTGLWGGK